MSEARARFSAVEAVAWTAIGVLAAAVLGSFGSFFYLGTRIDALGARLDARIDAQGADLGARIDRLSERVDSLERRLDARLDALAARLDEHLERHAG
jgi:hypothetical protein